MTRRIAVGLTAVAMIAILAGCGGSSPSPSASAGASTAPSTAAPSGAAASTSPSRSPDASQPAATARTMSAACAAVSVRTGATLTNKLLVRLAKGTKVRVVDSVTGDPYSATACGESGDDWVKIDRINGKSVKSLYGVSFGYAAGGFFR